MNEREYQQDEAEHTLAQEYEETMSQKVYGAINAVQAKLATVGIGKNRKNESQGYAFRGVDDVYNALARALADAHLCILPRVLNRVVTEQINAKGTRLFYVVVDMEFDFVSADDGSRHTVKTIGEAMDSGDKATNKAMSAAYKYACMQTFCIPTEGDNDSENQTHELPALDTATLAALEACQTLDQLRKAWEAIPTDKRPMYAKTKNDKRDKLSHVSLAEQA